MNDWRLWIDTARAPLEASAPPPPRALPANWRSALLLGALVLGLGWMSLELSRQPGSIAGVWYVNGLGIAWLAQTAPRQWPRALLAAAVGIVGANLADGDPLLRAVSFLPANLLEILLGAAALRHRRLHHSNLRRPADLLALLLWGGLLPPLASAALGALTVVAHGAAPHLDIALTWYQGALIGNLSILTLAMLALRSGRTQALAALRDPHLAWLLPVSLGVTLLCLGLVPFPFIYLSMPLLLAAMLVDFMAVALLTLAVSLTVALAIATGVFVPPPVTAQWQQVFVYLAYAAALFPAQLLAAALADLRDSHARLAARSEALRRANEGLEQFVRIASHDLREPLNTVVQFAALIEEDHGRGLPADARHWLGLVQAAATRMRVLLDDVLQYTRLQHAQQPEPAPVALEAVLAEVRQSLAGRLHTSGAVLRVGALPVVAGHAPLLQLLFLNLVANALKFVPPERAPVVAVVGQTEERDGKLWAVVTVIDNGIGIAAEDLPKLFKPFSRLNLRRHYDGSGLGLALCRQVAALHGGRIEVESTPGVGSRFTVRLPL